MYKMKISRAVVMVTFGLLSSASCRHNDGSSPASPTSPGGRTPDAGTTTRPNGIDDTKTGEPIGPVAGGLRVSSPVNGPEISARATDGLGGAGPGGPGGGGVGGVGAMGGLPPDGPRPVIGG
jgi:hypothetical protein